MLQIDVPSKEFYDEKTETFVQTKATTLILEHSLLSISKWEAKYHKPFLSYKKDDKRTSSEILDYIKCMTLNKNVPEEVYMALSSKNMIEINDYINDPMTATTVSQSPTSSGGIKIVTSEVIYYWMITFNIPFECEKWHINRLMMLIKVCNANNNPKKMSRNELLARNRHLNAARRKALGTKG